MPDATEQIEPVNLPRPAVRVQRWSWQLVLATVVAGGVSALAAALVRLGFRGLQWIFTGSGADLPIAAAHLPVWRRMLTPVLGAVLASVVLFLRKRRARRLGRDPRPYVEYVEAVRHRHGKIPLVPNCWRTASAAFSVASGAAVGREGSMIQFAAAVASVVGRWRGWLGGDDPDRLAFLVACGVAGGVTTAYNSPVAAVCFAAEIALGGFQWRELPLLSLAAGVGWVVSGALLGTARLYPTRVALHWGWGLALLPLLALLAGVLGPLYQWLLGSGRRLRALPLALVWSGAVVGVTSAADPRVWGNGDTALRAALGRPELPGLGLGAVALSKVLLLRLVATLCCVWTGTVGGVFTPTLFAGGAVGALASCVGAGGTADGAQTLWAVAGMSFLMAAVTHAPWMAGFIAVELTGDWKLLPILLPLNFVAWGLARRLSPRAMYSIASQAPARAPGVTPPDDRVKEARPNTGSIRGV